jgi:two-component system cell cycle sensor histidine kinase/response regulator CckA
MSLESPSFPTLSIGMEHLSMLLDFSRELFLILNGDHTIQYVSPSFSRVLGFAPDDLLGQPIRFLEHPQEEFASKMVVSREYLSQASAGARCRLRCKDGSWRWFDASFRLYSGNPALKAIVASYLDVTALHRMECERQVISDVVHALNETPNLDQLLKRIHEALKKVLYAENCFVALHQTQEDTFHFPFYADQFDEAPSPQKMDRSCTAYVFRTGKATLIPQSEFDRLAALGEVELVGSASPSWLGVPLKTPTATIGVLVVQHYQDQNAYGPLDLEFLDSVGGHIALAIERRSAEESLRKSESMFRLFFAYNPLPTWLFDRDTLRFLHVNDAAIAQYGYTREEFENITVLDVRPESEREKHQQHLKNATVEGRYRGVWNHRAKNGKTFEVEYISHDLEYLGRRVRLAVMQDVSERHQLEQQLRQAQKMEAVGRLAGGIAHDFNNLLMVIKGHTELLLNVLPPSDHVTRKIEQIDRSADRAAALTRQLLAFSRMQVLNPQVINLNGIVEEIGKLVLRLIGEDIELNIRKDADLGAVRADANQIEQIIMNLVVNARDAMPSGGRLLIETSNEEFDHSCGSSHSVMTPGRYVLLAVTDTGTGMDPETQARIFEPFFTTKEKGKGTGLGLATVYGVVKQSGGFIWVYSEVGKGTSFKIYLPRVEGVEDQPAPPRQLLQIPQGTETVLLAEDENDVRDIARQFLESGGYKVVEARDGAEALRVAAEQAGKIDLLVTDMIMPGMTGQELAGRLLQQNDGIRVIFMSGYSEHTASQIADITSAMRLLTKPFSRGSLLRAVREILDAAPIN